MNEVISKHFAEFVILKLVNRNSYEDGAAFITEGILKGIKVVVVENSDNRSGKIQQFQSTRPYKAISIYTSFPKNRMMGNDFKKD